MMKNKIISGHLASLFTVVVWGTTFISTKVLLNNFKPVEILLLRFLAAYIILLLFFPKALKATNRRQELIFAAAGLCGVCLYYLLENIALTYTSASNVGVIISVAPFFTAILNRFCFKEKEKMQMNFFIGFILAIAGIVLISFNGADLKLNPVGDLLALAAAIVWAFYSVLTRKISGFGYNTVLSTRRVFFYGIIFMLPAMLLFDFSPDLIRLAEPENLLNIIFLSLGASAMCFITWNFAVKVLGAVKTSVYIYMVPVITVAASAVFLNEKMTVLKTAGVLLTLAGLLLSESKILRKGARV